MFNISRKNHIDQYDYTHILIELLRNEQALTSEWNQSYSTSNEVGNRFGYVIQSTYI